MVDFSSILRRLFRPVKARDARRICGQSNRDSYSCQDDGQNGPSLRFLPVLACLVFGTLAGCSTGGNAPDPIRRSFGWFAYLDGSDIRHECNPTVDRYRFVYNGRWGEQVRTYEVVRSVPGSRGDLFARVMFPETLSTFGTDDLLAPWRGRKSEAVLTLADLAALDQALAESGFDGPAPLGAWLRSDATYWVVAACRGGQYHWNAWTFPSERFAGIRFADELFRRDRTGVAVMPPQARGERSIDRPDVGKSPNPFDLQAGHNGLRLVSPIF